jgi:hypothetical protein
VRVAILDPEPRVCGPTNWGFQLREGFRQLGHETQVVSYTKSGKGRKAWGNPIQGGRWWSSAPDLVVKNESLVPVLDSFDMIVLPEVKVPSKDKEALKAERLPDYVEALQRTTTRWTSALHGSMYPDRDTPFVEQLFDSPSRGRYLVTMSDASVESSARLQAIEWRLAPMPYTPQRAVDAPIVDTGIVGTTGRFIFNKGQPVVCIAAAFLPPELTVEVWGSCATGLGPSPTFVVYEALLKNFNAQGKRYSNQTEEEAAKYEFAHGNIVAPFPWDARPEGGALVRYLGNYSDQLGVASRLQVHINLTGYTFARGLVEYSSLEALDAGSLNIVPEWLSDDRFRMMTVKESEYRVAPSPTRLLRDEGLGIAKMLAEKIKACVNIPLEQRTEIVRHNREVLRERNDPRLCAQAMIDSAFS